jgi:hypothetical protein
VPCYGHDNGLIVFSNNTVRNFVRQKNPEKTHFVRRLHHAFNLNPLICLWVNSYLTGFSSLPDTFSLFNVFLYQLYNIFFLLI